MTTLSSVLFLLLCLRVASNGLVGPGGVTTYSGQGHQHRGWATIDSAAAGFFVAGSSIKDMNGVYHQIFTVPNIYTASLSYYNEMTHWHLVLASAPKKDASGEAPYTTKGGKEEEWLFLDPDNFSRFGHVGDTWIPGAGKQWRHLHRREPWGNSDTASSVVDPSGKKQVEDDEDELPYDFVVVCSCCFVLCCIRFKNKSFLLN